MGQARGPRWRSVPTGLYVPANTTSDALDQRIVEAVLGCGAGAAATGWAALGWRRGRWFGGRANRGELLAVPVALGDQRAVRPRRGVELSEDWLFDDDVVEVDGLAVTIAERSVAYEARRAATLTRAVQAIDMAAYDDLVDLASLAEYAARLTNRPGVRRLRTALALAEENAWSPMETSLRLAWHGDQPGARVLCNAPIFDNTGHHLLTPDVLDPVAGVAGEYDGVTHLEDGPRRRDLDRDELYRDLGIEVATMMSADARDLTDFRVRLAGAYRRARRRRGDDRIWTLERPHWWVDTSTVARRRALDDLARSIWLRYRAA